MGSAQIVHLVPWSLFFERRKNRFRVLIFFQSYPEKVKKHSTLLRYFWISSIRRGFLLKMAEGRFAEDLGRLISLAR